MKKKVENPVRATNTPLVAFLTNFVNSIDRGKKKAMLQPQYQLATLYAPKHGTWLIPFYCFHPVTQKLERLRPTFNLNRIKSIKERRRVGELHVKNINEALENGWNYFVHVEGLAPVEGMPTLPAEQQAEVAPTISIAQALHKGLRARLFTVTEDRTIGSYKSFVNTFLKWLELTEQDTLPISKLTGDLFQEYLYYKKYEREHGNSNLNDTISFFKTTFDTMKAAPLKLLAENPIKDMKYLTESESDLFEPITANELEQILPAIVAYNPRLYLFTKFIALNFMRPHHIARLKASQISYSEDLIYLNPETTKNKKVTSKQLSPELKKTLIALGCHELPGHYYIFSDRKFNPGPTLYKNLSIRAAEDWRKIVKEGLNIDKRPYCLKSTGATYLLNKNDEINIVWFSDQMEHSSLEVTQRYIRKRTVKKVDQAKVNTIDY